MGATRRNRADAMSFVRESQHLPRVVLVGRPNAGKSTLFNRLLRQRKALVDPTPGVTRDPNQAVVTWDGHAVLLLDTGGFEADGAVGLEHAVRERTLAAVGDANLVLYVLDGKAGLSPADEAAARELRRLGANVLFVVNKLDSPRREATAGEFHRLGAAELVAVSAEHGHGIGALVEVILAQLARVAPVTATVDEQPATVPEALPATLPEAPPAAIRVSVVGRPNVGKSSLVNRLLGYPRALVDARAGTTRDAVDTLLEVEGIRYLLVDTAGIRRRARIHERLERSAAGKAMEALARSDVAVVVFDASEGATEQDLRLTTLAWDEGRAVVAVANKWDLQTAGAAPFVAKLRARFPSLADVPVLTVSALTGAGVETILPAVKRVAAAHDAELKTARLNDVLAAAVRAQEPPVVHGRRPRIYYATQVRRRPPEIAIFTSAPTGIHPSYGRYLQKQIAAAFGLRGTPVRLHFRARH
jgi:GTP-binding protein